ncbi:hypothetical protein [Piscinibacter sp.]|jgi:uncharacterized protein with HEPN domain|uniref:hypothetical protein n=1 Tax=Piscinibacter sp. TaxID=1903157 RepID=UPI00355956CF
MTLLSSALLSIVDEAGRAVLTLTEGLARDEFLGSRLTRAEVLRQTRVLAAGTADVPPGVRERMTEVDWAGWATLRRQLAAAAPTEQGDALWFAVQSLVPATLLWLQVYRKNEPALFRIDC